MQHSCFGFREATDTAVLQMRFIYLWLLLLQRIFSSLLKLGKRSIHVVYIDMSCPQNFKITLLTVTQNLYLFVLALTEEKKAIPQIQPI